MKYTSEFFLTSSGKSPVEDFLNPLHMRTKQKFLYVRSLLEEFGTELKLPFCKYLRGGIHELRFTGKEGAVRVMYFFIKSNRIIFTNGFVPFEEMPDYLSAMDICTNPFNHTHPTAYYSDPIKIWEYLALKKPVITSPIPDTVLQAGPYVNVAINKENYVDIIMKYVQNPRYYEDKA